MLLQNISKNLLLNTVYLPRTLASSSSSSTLPCEPYSSHCTSCVWDATWTGLIVTQDDDSGNGSVSPTFSYFMNNNIGFRFAVDLIQTLHLQVMCLVILLPLQAQAGLLWANI